MGRCAARRLGPGESQSTYYMAAPSATRIQRWDLDDVVILCGTGGELLAEEIAGIIGLPSSSCLPIRSSDGESHVRVGANVRGRDVFVVQSTSDPVNSTLIELAFILSACRRASARRVTAVTPYLGYGRQTRKAKSRVPISAADVATLLEECCLDGLVTIDAHDAMIAGFYSPRCAFENLSYVPVAARFLARKGFKSSVVVAPATSTVTYAMTLVETLRELDARHATKSAAAAAAEPEGAHDGIIAGAGGGSASVAQPACTSVSLAAHTLGPTSLDASLAASAATSSVSSPLPLRANGDRGAAPPEAAHNGRSSKRTASLAMLLPVERRGAKDRGVKELELTGDVAGRDCILVDDMIDTGLTLTKASRELIARGASCVVAFATHALLSHDAADRLARCEELSFIVITNSLPVMASLPKDHRLRRKLVVLSAAPMLAHQICTLSGLPLPDIDPREPTHSLHASSGPSVEEACTPAYLMRKAEAEAFRGSQPGSTEGDSLFDEEGGMRSGRDRDGDSVTTESEYSAY